MPPVQRSPLKAPEGDRTMSSSSSVLDNSANNTPLREDDLNATERSALEEYLAMGDSLLDQKRSLECEIDVVNARMMKLDEILAGKAIGKGLAYQMRLVCMHAMAVASHAIRAYKEKARELERRKCDYPTIRLVEDRVKAQSESLEKVKESLARVVHVQTEIHGVGSEIKDLAQELNKKLGDQAPVSLDSEQSQPQGSSSWSDVVRSKPRRGARSRPIAPKFPLVVTTTLHQDSKKTKEDLIGAADPAEMGLGVRNVNQGNEGRVYIDLDSKEEADRLKRELTSNLIFSASYKVEDSARRKPTVRIFNVPERYSDETLLKAILAQNEQLRDKLSEEELLRRTRVKFVSKPFKGVKRVVLEVDAELWRLLIDIGKLKIGWSLCRAENYLSFPQCFVCCGFGHLSEQAAKGNLPERRCEKAQVCDYCAGPHKFKDCTVRNDPGAVKCVNCEAERLRDPQKPRNIRTDHRASSDACPILRRKRENEIAKTDYGC